MGTISDKLMRVINTKEDIRQALISKGYDVPTSIPFKEYAKMILDLPCKADSFPDIEGIVARYSASGLTNEEMSKNPVCKDLTGNGHDLQMKNFAWGGMSGAGGYEMNFNLWGNDNLSTLDITVSKTSTHVKVDVKESVYNNNLIYIHKNNWDINKNHWLKITSTYDDGDLLFLFYNENNTKKIKIPANGYVNIPAYPEFKGSYMYISTISDKQGSFTIEQLPLYPGALVFDGVDDYGVCDNFPILTKEKGYTVVALRQWISTPTTYAALVSKLNISTDGSFVFEEYNNGWLCGSFGKYTEAITVNNNNPISWQTSKSYNGESLNVGTSNDTDVLSLGKLYHSNNKGSFVNIALYSLVILDHDATEEELTKIKDYFVKTYPWLFPDQAWTVTGKTNEDKDRATIANITGNGNDLVLSNFGFAEGSGYGLYGVSFDRWRIEKAEHTTASKDSISAVFSSINTVNFTLLFRLFASEIKDAVVNSFKIKVNGLVDGQTLLYNSIIGGKISTAFTITKDGVYELPSIQGFNGGDYYGFAFSKVQESCDITIEQIPEYEGYLVTDGVDDKINSSNFDLGKDWTIVGDWTMLSNIPSNCGIIKASSLFLYNSIDSVTIYINNGGRPIKIQSKSINAICSDGRIYLNDWTEISKPGVQTELGSKANLNITSYGTTFTKMAFKNLAIYDGKILSKDDCIKAYNYLQTLKSK